jgi:hypothetical protein
MLRFQTHRHATIIQLIHAISLCLLKTMMRSTSLQKLQDLNYYELLLQNPTGTIQFNGMCPQEDNPDWERLIALKRQLVNDSLLEIPQLLLCGNSQSVAAFAFARCLHELCQRAECILDLMWLRHEKGHWTWSSSW